MQLLLRAERYIRHSAGIVITKLHRILASRQGREEQRGESTHSYTAMATHAIRTSIEKALLGFMAFQGLPPSKTSDMTGIRVVRSSVRSVVGRSVALRSRWPRSWGILLTAPASLWSQYNPGLSGGESGDSRHNGNRRHLSLCYVTFHDEVHLETFGALGIASGWNWARHLARGPAGRSVMMNLLPAGEGFGSRAEDHWHFELEG